MEQIKPFNPMPESLDDIKPNPQDILGPQSHGVMGEAPPEGFTSERRNEIDRKVSAAMTNNMLEREILDEKIRQDINSAKQNRSIKDIASPRDILKTLISFGDYKEDVKIFEHVWTIKALNQGDIITAFGEVKDDNVTVSGRVSSLVLAIITYAVEACDGQPIYEWFPDLINRADYSSAEEFKLASRKIFRRYLERMPNNIIAEFDTAYNNIEQKRNEAIEELKKS